MNAKQIIHNIINRENLETTCSEIISHIYQSWHYDEDAIWCNYFDNYSDNNQHDTYEILNFYVKEWILNALHLNQFNNYHNIKDLFHELNHFSEDYLKDILMQLANEKKILLNDYNFALFSTEKKRRQLLEKIQNASEEELDKLL